MEELEAVRKRDGVPVSEQVRRGIGLWLAKANGGSVGAQAVRAPEAVPEPVTVKVRPQLAQLAQAQAAVSEPVCRRCQHPKSKHVPKGCVAGCLCNEARYLSS